MDEYKNTNEALMQICDAKEKMILNATFAVNNLDFRKLAFILIEIGKIEREDLKNNIYVVTIPAGIAKKNYSVVAIELSHSLLKIAAYSQEGIINQHTSEGAINEIKKHISEYIKED